MVSFSRFCPLFFTCIWFGSLTAVSEDNGSVTELKSIKVSPVTIRLIRECEIPARDSGILEEIAVDEGQEVALGKPLASLESRQQELAVEMARLVYEAAQEDAANDTAVLAAEDGLRAAELKRATLEVSLNVAKNVAENTSGVEIAKTDQGTSLLQLDRAKSAKERYDSSVSEAELTRLNAQFRKAELSVAEAVSHHLTSELQVQVHDAELAEQQAVISRQRHLVELERRKLSQALKAAETRRVELDIAKTMLDRRQIVSPISGIVVKRYRQPGEFVDAGTSILRVIQLNRLRAEGFLDIRVASPSLIRRPVRISLSGSGTAVRTFDGIVTYVGHEVDPLNQQVRVCAEFDSPELTVYPGTTAEMMILEAGSASEGSLTSGENAETD